MRDRIKNPALAVDMSSGAGTALWAKPLTRPLQYRAWKPDNIVANQMIRQRRSTVSYV
jgi:hypothetical protein